MPDARLERTRHLRPTVPPCVRLGHAWRFLADVARYECLRCRLRVHDVCRIPIPPWRPPHANAAEQLATRGWNVIEGEDH